MNGGACWLDRDPKGGNDDDGAGSVTALQHVYSSFTASAVNQNGKPGAPGSSKEDDCTNNSVLKEGIYSKTGIMEGQKFRKKF